MKCAGYKTSGYWKGYKCAATPKHKIEHEGVIYEFCANHYAKAIEGQKKGHLPNCPACFGFNCECGKGLINEMA